MHDQIDTITSSSVITGGRCRSPCFEERPANAIVSADVESRQARVDFADAIPSQNHSDDFAADLQRLSLAFCKRTSQNSHELIRQMSWILHLCTDCSLGAQSRQPPDWERPQFGGRTGAPKMKAIFNSKTEAHAPFTSGTVPSHVLNKIVFTFQIQNGLFPTNRSRCKEEKNVNQSSDAKPFPNLCYLQPGY